MAKVHLWGHVAWCATEGASASCSGGGLRFAKVTDLDVLLLLVYQDVCRLEIAMGHIVVVQVHQPFQKLQGECTGLLCWHQAQIAIRCWPIRPQEGCKRAPSAELHETVVRERDAMCSAIHHPLEGRNTRVGRQIAMHLQGPIVRPRYNKGRRNNAP